MHRKKKILCVITKSNFGGAQKYVYDLATSMPRDQFDVTVALGGNGILKQKLDERGVRTVVIPSLERDAAPLKDLGVFFLLIRIFKKERPDIVHLNSSKIGGLGSFAARISGIPKIIFTVHGLPLNEPRFSRLRLIVAFLSWLSCIFSNSIIAVSSADFKIIKKWPGLGKKVCRISNGIKPFELLTRENARALLASRCGLKEKEGLWVGTIAELHANKGLIYLLKGFKGIKNQSRLLIVGSGEEEKKLKKYAQKERLGDRVSFVGFIDEAEKILPAFDIFVLPSLKEGLPYVILEAGFAGLPIVATTIGGIPEIIENQKNGILIPPKDRAALTRALSLLIQRKDLRDEYGREISKKIKEKFSFEDMFEKTAAFYK